MMSFPRREYQGLTVIRVKFKGLLLSTLPGVFISLQFLWIQKRRRKEEWDSSQFPENRRNILVGSWDIGGRSSLDGISIDL